MRGYNPADDINFASLIYQRDEMIHELKNLCNVFGQGLDPMKNECQHRAIASAKRVLNKAEAAR